MNNINSDRLFARIVIALVIPTLAGCQNNLFNPHLKHGSLVDPSSATRAIHFAGDIESAIDAANDQRELYFKAVGDRAVFRNSIATALIPLSAALVYKGLTTDSVSARRSIALGGATAGAGYAFFGWFTNRTGEAAYLEGYRGITCAILRTRPYLIPTDDFIAWQENAATLRTEVKKLDDMTNRAEIQLRIYREMIGESDRFAHNVLSEIRAARTARLAGEKKLKQYSSLKPRIETAGFTLRKRVDLMVTAVSEEVQRSEPRLDQLQSVVSGIASQNTANVDALRADTLDLREFTFPDNPKGASATESKGAAAPASAVSNPGSAIDAEIAKLTRKLAELNAAQAKTSKDAQKSQKELKDLKAQVDALQKARAAMPAAPGSEAIATSKEIARVRDALSSMRTPLALQKALVYQARNKVDIMFERVYRLHRSTRDIPECRSTTGTMLAVTPSEDQVLKDGESLTFTITGGEGVPRLLLSGSTGTGEKETTLNVSIVGGIVTATVKPGKTLPTGAVYLVITDANGKHREEIVITPQAVAPAGS